MVRGRVCATSAGAGAGAAAAFSALGALWEQADRRRARRMKRFMRGN
jgi:hypothetical protein